jgi:hypothetical protein
LDVIRRAVSAYPKNLEIFIGLIYIGNLSHQWHSKPLSHKHNKKCINKADKSQKNASKVENHAFYKIFEEKIWSIKKNDYLCNPNDKNGRFV